MRRKGEVVLVGAGPGDPGLLTLAGREALASAEVVVHDYLVDPRVLAMAPPSALRIYAGKRAGQHRFPQEQIHRILVRHARRGQCVVRLKGGDPFVFGRGGEEALACRKAGISFRIIPGVTSGSAVPAYAGMPVTHRGLASAVAFVTGHEDPAKGGKGIAWKSLAHFPGTLVFFMPMKALPGIARNLIAHGMSLRTPAAAIRSGTLPEQKTVTAPLSELPRRAARLGTPALIVVGKVAALGRRLTWSRGGRLTGRTIAVTRAQAQASRLEALLEAEGARVLRMPAIRIAPPSDPAPWRKAVRALAEGQYRWLVLTSPNAASALGEGLAAAGRDARALAGVRIAALGPATAEALAVGGIRADLLPTVNTSQGLARTLSPLRAALSGQRLLLPCSDLAPQNLSRALRKLGARVDAIQAYRTLIEPLPPEALEALRKGMLDAVLLTSSSTALGFAMACRKARLGRPRTRLVSIGPETSKTLRREGFRVSAEARPHTLEGLLKALRSTLPPRRGNG